MLPPIQSTHPRAAEESHRGGGVLTTEDSWIHGNGSDFGGGLFLGETATASLNRTTISGNIGGGVHSHSDGDWEMSNSTLSGNSGGAGAVFNGKKDGLGTANADSESPSISQDGRYVVFSSIATNLVHGDDDNVRDIFVFDKFTEKRKRITVSASGNSANGDSSHPQISENGRFVVFESDASNLDPSVVNPNALSLPVIYRHDLESSVTELCLGSTENGICEPVN